MNNIGMAVIRNELTSRIWLTFSNLNSRAMNNKTIPYMLAGIGSGIIQCSSSPKNANAAMIKNCMMYFMFFRRGRVPEYTTDEKMTIGQKVTQRSSSYFLRNLVIR